MINYPIVNSFIPQIIDQNYKKFSLDSKFINKERKNGDCLVKKCLFF